MTTVKNLQELDQVRAEVPEAKIRDNVVAAFIAKHNIEDTMAKLDAYADEREYLLDDVLNRIRQEIKELRAKREQVYKEKVLNHPDLLLLRSQSKALHDRLYKTRNGKYGKISQISPGSEESQLYNAMNDMLKSGSELQKVLYTHYVQPLDMEIEALENDPQFDMAKALKAAEDAAFDGEQE